MKKLITLKYLGNNNNDKCKSYVYDQVDNVAWRGFFTASPTAPSSKRASHLSSYVRFAAFIRCSPVTKNNWDIKKRGLARKLHSFYHGRDFHFHYYRKDRGNDAVTRTVTSHGSLLCSERPRERGVPALLYLHSISPSKAHHFDRSSCVNFLL